jgi:hypothetical protein
MSRASPSGYALSTADVALVLGMIARDDRSHDIAAWFGVNQGRIKDAKDGKFGAPAAAQAHSLPPKGPPGIKGRRLRDAVETALGALAGGNAAEAKTILKAARKQFDANEA